MHRAAMLFLCLTAVAFPLSKHTMWCPIVTTSARRRKLRWRLPILPQHAGRHHRA